MPRPVTARFALTANSGVLAVSPDGTATVYENPDSAVEVTTDHTGATTVRPVGNNTVTSAGGRALSAMSTVASSSGSTLVVLDPQHTATSPVGAGQAAGATQYLPVILVHGTWGNAEGNFGALLPALEAAGVQAFTYDYGRIPWLPINLIRADAGAEAPIQDSTQRLAQEITKVLAATGAPQVNLIGASQGGLVIKNYLAQAADNVVANVVDINATNHGTTLSGPGKLLDPAIVDEAFAPIHSAITGVTQTLSNTLKLAGPLRVMQGPVALAGAAAHIATGIAQEAVKIPVTAVQKILRVALSLVIGPAGVQQAVGSEFLNRLNRTPDTKAGVNYLVLGSKDDTTATPYESTFLKASPGSAVINVEEHSLPGVKPTDVIGHIDTPQPVVDTIVRFLTAADTHPAVDTKIDRSLGVTITEDSGVTTVRSGDNTILYQGPSSNSAAVKRAIGQAIDTTATDGSTALAAGTETTQASAPETDRMLAATKTSSPDTEHADVSVSASTAPVSRQATSSPQATATTHQPAASGDTPSTATTTNGTRATDTRLGTTASSDHTTTQTEAATATDTATKSRVRQRANTGAGSSTDNVSTASGQKDSAATVADGPSTGPSTSTPDKVSRETLGTKTSAAKTDSKPKTTADSPTKTSPKTKTRETDNATTKPNDTTPRTKSTPGSSAGGTPSAKGTATAAGHAPSAQSTRGSRRDTTGSAHDGSSQHSSSPKRSDN